MTDSSSVTAEASDLEKELVQLGQPISLPTWVVNALLFVPTIPLVLFGVLLALGFDREGWLLWASLMGFAAARMLPVSSWRWAPAKVAVWPVVFVACGATLEMSYRATTFPTGAVVGISLLAATFVVLFTVLRRKHLRPSTIALGLLLVATAGATGNAHLLVLHHQKESRLKAEVDAVRDARFAAEKKTRTDETMANYESLMAAARDAVSNGDIDAARPVLHQLAEAQPNDTEVKALQTELDHQDAQARSAQRSPSCDEVLANGRRLVEEEKENCPPEKLPGPDGNPLPGQTVDADCWELHTRVVRAVVDTRNACGF